MKLLDVTIPPEARKYIWEAVENNRLSEGSVVALFESRLKEFFKFKNIITVNSGTSALHLALKLAGVGPGDEVILPAQTFIATGLAVLYCGATPVFVDIYDNGIINSSKIIPAITNKTKAVIMVHWLGQPCYIETVNSICQPRGIKTIEDAAQALGSKYMGEYIGSGYTSDFVCFSFQATKLVSTGDGGAIVCKSNEDYERGRKLKWFGIDRQNDKPDRTGERLYDLKEIGYKYQLNDWGAAVGLGYLDYVSYKINQRRTNTNLYHNLLYNVPGVKLQQIDGVQEACYWAYPISVDYRNDLIEKLKQNDIEASVIHTGIDRNTIFGGLRSDLRVQRYYESHLVCLPVHENIDPNDILKVCDVIRSGW